MSNRMCQGGPLTRLWRTERYHSRASAGRGIRTGTWIGVEVSQAKKDVECSRQEGAAHTRAWSPDRAQMKEACVLSCSNHVRLFATLWTIAHQAPLSLGFSRQESWSALPWPPPGGLPDPWFKPVSLISLALMSVFFTISTTWDAHREA